MLPVDATPPATRDPSGRSRSMLDPIPDHFGLILDPTRIGARPRNRRAETARPSRSGCRSLRTLASDNGSSVNRITPVFPGVSPRSRDYGDVAAPVIRLESTARRSRSAARAASSACAHLNRGSAAPPQRDRQWRCPAPTMRQVSVARSQPISTRRFARSASRATLIGVGDDWQANGLTVYFCTNGVGTLICTTAPRPATARRAVRRTSHTTRRLSAEPVVPPLVQAPKVSCSVPRPSGAGPERAVENTSTLQTTFPRACRACSMKKST